MTTNRQFDAARQAQGFRSQAHLDAFFAAFDHVQGCAACKARDGYVLLDDGYQPTEGRCDVARTLDAATSAAAMPASAPISTTVRRGSKEWRRMWRELERCWGAASQPSADGLEDWQYMGTSGGRHEFRHRNHPVKGRVVWTTPAL